MKKQITSSNSKDYCCYYYWYHWEWKCQKSYSNQKGLKWSHLSLLMQLHEVFFCFIDYHSYTRDIQLFATRIVFIICMVDAIYIKNVLTQQAWRAFRILWPNKYSPGSKIAPWLVSEIELAFETRDLGLTCNTGPYKINGRSCGWYQPSGVRILCHIDDLTRDYVTIDTVCGDWRYITI